MSARGIMTHPAAPSLWAATAPPALETPPLAESLACDVLIVGAGFTGLSTALHLSEQGAKVCVLDAHQPGWGASGRNGGQVNPTFKYDPEELLRIYGAARGERLIEFVSGTADTTFDLIQRFDIACSPVRAGWLQLGYTQEAVDTMHVRARQWERYGVTAEPLDRAQVQQRTGTTVFAGGWRDGRAGAIQPLAYAYGLARAAKAAGARIFGESPVIKLNRDNGIWVAATGQGHSVRAQQVVLATNGYTDGLWPGLAQSVLSANSFIIATKPLQAQGAGILSQGETASTSQRLLLYFRKDATGRLLMGGRGHFSDPNGTVDFAHLERTLSAMYPQFGRLEYDFRWAGRIAITRDFMPHLHQPEPGITVALGYNGRGIALATAMGKEVAALLGGRESAMPLTPISPIPMHGLQRFYIAAGVAWYSLLDRLGR